VIARSTNRGRNVVEGIALGYGDQDWAAIARVIAANAGIERTSA
jgi:hypothetical protein